MTDGQGFHVVIPARYGSSRLPGKPLLDLCGKPMVERVIEQALASNADTVVVATDDERVLRAVEATGALAVLTDPDLPSGSDRVMAAVRQCGFAPNSTVVNVQGDEPLIPPTVIDQVAQLLRVHTDVGTATLYEPIGTTDDVFNPNIVKVVVSTADRALYFSRAAIPWQRGEFDKYKNATLGQGWKRHIGIYAYRCATLEKFVNLPAGELEGVEALEQLRLLAHGYEIAIAESVVPVPGGVDTPEDADRVRALLTK